MKRRAVLAAGAIVIAGCADLVSAPEPAEAESAIQQRINDARHDAHLGTLQIDARLQSSARDHSRDMHERDFYAHRNPDGQEPWDRVLCDAAENLHRGDIGRMQNVDGDETWSTTDADELAGFVVEGWELSDGHRRNMLDGQWRAMGVGVAIQDGEFFVTAKFC